jgi:hypothetical protein
MSEIDPTAAAVDVEDLDPEYTDDSLEADTDALAEDNPVHDANPTEIQDDEVAADGES